MTDFFPKCRECGIDHAQYTNPTGLASVLENLLLHGRAISPDLYCSDECRAAAEVRAALRPKTIQGRPAVHRVAILEAKKP